MAVTDAVLRLKAQVTGENDIKRLGNSMQGVQGKVKNLRMAVGGLSTAFKALGAALAVGAFGSFIKGTIDQADALGKLSTRTGIAANSLQAFVNAGRLADVSQKQLETGLKTFARTSFEAAQGVKTYSEAYASLGVEVKKADGTLKASDSLLKEIADKFKTLPNGPEKAAIAMRLFGKSGADMITLLNGGSEALERFNYEVSENFSQNAEYFNDQLTILQIQFDGFRKQLLDALLPALNAIIEVFSEMFASETDWTSLFGVIEFGIRGTAIVVKSLIDLFDELIRGVVSSVRVIGKVLKGDIPGAIAEVGNAYKGLFDRAAKNKAQYDKLAFGRSEVGSDYGGGGSGAFMRSAADPASTRGGTRRRGGKTEEEKAAERARKAVEDYDNMIAKLSASAAEFKTITIEAIEVTAEQGTAFDGVKAAAASYLESIGSLNDGIAGLTGEAFKGLEDALVGLVTTGKANFLDFAQAILASTARMIVQQTILKSIMSALGSIGGGATPTSPFGGPQVVTGGTGIDGSSFGQAAFSKIIPFGGFKARGGRVGRGLGYIVGENGPEYFRPGMSGEIVPNHKLPKMVDLGGKFMPFHPLFLAAMFGTGNFGGNRQAVMEGFGARFGNFGHALPRANGGPVTTGANYLVGEKGPELFVAANGGGGGSVGSVVVNVDAKGTSVEGSSDDSNRLGKALGAAVRAELIRQKRPGGLLA